MKVTLQEQREELLKQQRALKSAQNESDDLEAKLQGQANQRRDLEKNISKLQQSLSKSQNEILIVEHDLKNFEKDQQSFKDNETAINKELETLKIELSETN